MASSSLKRPSARRRQRANDFTEWITAGLVILSIAVGGYLVLTSPWFQIRQTTQIDLGTDRPVNQLSGASCSGQCRMSFQRCTVSTQGFIYMRSDCQESLKQCLIGCDQSIGIGLKP